MKMIIGLTGGIASGKSTAAKYLQSVGAHVIDADLLGHRAYEPGTDAHRKVIDAFGEAVRQADDQIDRKALGAKVFGDPKALVRLTDIVWPEIRRLAEAEIDQIRTTSADRVVVLEAAVLIEAGWQDIADEVWVVIVDRNTAVTRAMARDGADEAAVQARIDSQLSNEARTAEATVVIDNSGTEDEMIARLETEWQRILRIQRERTQQTQREEVP